MINVVSRNTGMKRTIEAPVLVHGLQKKQAAIETELASEDSDGHDDDDPMNKLQ